MKTTRTLRRSGIISLAFVCLLTLDLAWALARKGNSTEPKDRGWDFGALAKVPERERAKHNPLENDPDAQAAGRKLFDQHCGECHGHSGEGGRRGPSLRVEQVRQAAPGTLYWILTNGVVRRGMPDWSKLPEPERWQIVTYLHGLQ